MSRGEIVSSDPNKVPMWQKSSYCGTNACGSARQLENGTVEIADVQEGKVVGGMVTRLAAGDAYMFLLAIRTGQFDDMIEGARQAAGMPELPGHELLATTEGSAGGSMQAEPGWVAARQLGAVATVQ